MRGEVGNRIGRILGIWAHPDDESYLAAGLMMRAGEAGDRVVCVTATRGEQGSTDPQRWPPGPQLAKVRTMESAEAMRLIGVREHIWLDYADGELPEVDTDEVLDRLVAIAEDVRPDVITTFHPSGLTGHRDHQTVSRWATLLAERLDPSPPVWYAVHRSSQLERYLDRMQALGVFMNDDVPESVPDDQAITIALTEAEIERKWASLVVQQSQTEKLFELMGDEMMRGMFGTESFIDDPFGRPAGG